MATTATAQPEYQTGFFSSPSDLQLAAQQVENSAAALDAAISAGAGSAPQSWQTAWTAWRATWTTFYQGKFGASANVLKEWLTTDLEGQLQTFEQSISTWASQAAGYGISAIGPVPTAPHYDIGDLLPSGGLVLGALGLIALTVIAWKVF